MTTVDFDFQEPAELESALRLLAEGGQGTMSIAGGTDLLRELRHGVKRPTLLVSLQRLDTLRGVREDGDDLVVGPLTTMTELAEHPLVLARLSAVSDAASRMGSNQVRNRATIGGNLCNARPCADTAPGIIVLDAVLELRSAAGSRCVPAADFITAPGRTLRQPGELLTAIRFPALRAHSGSCFVTLTNRKAVEITITSATARVTLDAADGTIAAASICLGSVGPTPMAGTAAVAALIGRAPEPDTLRAAAAAAMGDASPIDDFRGSGQYRRWMVEVLTRRAIEGALARARGGSA